MAVSKKYRLKEYTDAYACGWIYITNELSSIEALFYRIQLHLFDFKGKYELVEVNGCK